MPNRKLRESKSEDKQLSLREFKAIGNRQLREFKGVEAMKTNDCPNFLSNFD